MSEFSHWNEEGRAKMVDISQKTFQHAQLLRKVQFLYQMNYLKQFKVAD